MISIGHRGSPVECLENSMASFQKAIATGAKRIELDVQLSADKIPYVLHDETLDRTSQGQGLINALESKQLDKIKLKNNEPLPKLVQVVEMMLPRIELNIELKGNIPETVPAVLHTLPPLERRPHRVIISSFHMEFLQDVNSRAPHEEVALLWDKPISILEVTAAMETCQSHIFHPEAGAVDAKLMSLAQQKHWEVFPWVSLLKEQAKKTLWRRLYSLGVDGLCTNYPAELTAFLEEQEQYV